MTQNMCKNGRQFRNLLELQEEAEYTWDYLDDSLLHFLAKPLPSRSQSVLLLNGAGTRY